METAPTFTPIPPDPDAEDAHKTDHKSARIPRVDVIPRGERRWTWTPEQKREIVMESLGPELTPTEVAAILTGCGKSLKRMQCAQFSNIQRGSTSNYIATMHVFVDRYYRPSPFSAACKLEGVSVSSSLVQKPTRAPKASQAA